MKLRKQIGNSLAGPVIETSRGFIGQQKLGASGQRSRKCYTLRLTPGQFSRTVRTSMFQTYFIELMVGYGRSCRILLTTHEQGHHHVFPCRELGKQRRILPYETNLAILKIRDSSPRQTRQINTV